MKPACYELATNACTDAREVQALDAVSLQVNVGGFLCLVGPSGCGKTTLLNIIAGLEKPDSGQVLADGKPITEPGRDRMVMFQEPALFPWLDVMGLAGAKRQRRSPHCRNSTASYTSPLGQQGRGRQKTSLIS